MFAIVRSRRLRESFRRENIIETEKYNTQARHQDDNTYPQQRRPIQPVIDFQAKTFHPDSYNHRIQ